MPELTEGFPEWCRAQENVEDLGRLTLFNALASLLGETRAPNIEQILTFLDDAARFKEEPYSRTVRAWEKPFVAGSEELTALAEMIRTYIRETLSVSLPTDRFAYLSGLLDFRTDDAPLDIFTLNYDCLVEATCARQGIRFTTGFSDAWDPDLFTSSPGWAVRVFKLHGSVNWYRVGGGGPIYQGDETHHAYPGVSSREELLYPAGGKAAHAEPFATLMSFFSDALQNADFLVALGYSFQDDHIRRMVLDRLVTNRNLQVLVANPTAQDVFEIPEQDPTASTFRDLPDRAVGLWFPTKSALENRLVFHRMKEVQATDRLLAEFEYRRSARSFDQAAESFLATLYHCRMYQLGGKMSRILATSGVGNEFVDALERRIKGTVAGARNVLRMAMPKALEGFPTNLTGGNKATIVTLLEMVTLSEIYRFDDAGSFAEDALRDALAMWVDGLAVSQGGVPVGWPASPGETNEQRLTRQRSYVDAALQGLVDRPPILPSGRERLNWPDVLTSCLTLLKKYHEVLDIGRHGLTLNAGSVVSPEVPGKKWKTALAESTEAAAFGAHAIVKDWCPPPEALRL